MSRTVQSSSANRILIFGATHVGMRLAERLVALGRRVCLVAREEEIIADGRWERIRSDFSTLPELHDAQLVYVVTDEDELNIRLALSVRRANATLPIVVTLTQSRLGDKLSRHLTRFAYVNPPELAATRFVDAVYATKPEHANQAPVVLPGGDTEDKARWSADPLIVRALFVIASIALMATVYFHLAEKLSWINALYFVVTMMATVGFGDISLKDASVLSKLVGILVMIASVANTAVIIALITDSLLKKRLVLAFGRRRIRQTGHVVVAGIGSVGWRVVEQLVARGESVVVIDSHETGRYLPAVYARRLPAIIGDARLERTLRDAGIDRAKALLSVTNDDLANLEIGLNAKVLNPEMRVVLRIFDQELAESLREQLDIHFALSMSSIAAERLAHFAEAPPGDAIP